MHHPGLCGCVRLGATIDSCRPNLRGRLDVMIDNAGARGQANGYDDDDDDPGLVLSGRGR